MRLLGGDINRQSDRMVIAVLFSASASESFRHVVTATVSNHKSIRRTVELFGVTVFAEVGRKRWRSMNRRPLVQSSLRRPHTQRV